MTPSQKGEAKIHHRYIVKQDKLGKIKTTCGNLKKTNCKAPKKLVESIKRTSGKCAKSNGQLRKTKSRKSPEKELKKEAPPYRCTSGFEAILGSFFDDFSIDFSVRFLDHFWSHFGPILGARMEPKSIKNRFKIRSKFQSDFGVVLGPFLINFERILETLNPQKWCSRVGAVLFLRKSRFSDQIRFWIDFFMIFNAFGDHFG